MRLAAVLFVAAAVFAAAVVAGVIRLGSAQPAPPAIVVGGGSRHVPPVADRAPTRSARSAVLETVEHTSMSRYEQPRVGGREP